MTGYLCQISGSMIKQFDHFFNDFANTKQKQSNWKQLL